VDLVCGGFPCQPWSAAGQRRGTDDDRHLWPEMARIVSELRPRWVVGENVLGIFGPQLDSCASDLESQGYAVWPVVLPACALDAPHRRERMFIIAGRPGDLADPSRELLDRGRGVAGTGRRPKPSDRRENMADPDSARLQRPQSARLCERPRERPSGQSRSPEPTARPIWQPEPNVGRVADGVPRRVDRLKSLGNSVVPQVAELIGRILIETDVLIFPMYIRFWLKAALTRVRDAIKKKPKK
jgi:DNA (cytosine-5)-methyltransferase 1